MKKLILFALAAVMVLACAAPALAATPAPAAKDPVLTLKVAVQNTGTGNDMRNVTYLARLSNVPPVTTSNKPITVDFYTGSPLLTVYPNQYLGSATVNKDGVAQLNVYQAPGEYAGGAIWVRTAQGKVCSNVVIYKVPPIKPRLKLEVSAQAAPAPTGNSDAALPQNVTYKVTLRPIQAGKVRFYTGPSNGRFPGQYLGSAELDRSGIASLRFYQAPGKYTGGAIYIVTDSGKKLYSNVVSYQVTAITEIPNDAVAEKDARDVEAVVPAITPLPDRKTASGKNLAAKPK